MTKMEQIKDLIEQNDGILTTRMLDENKIHRQYIKLLLDEEYIFKVTRGIYSRPGVYVNEYYITSQLYKDAIFSHSTALYFYNLTDRTPFALDVTFPSNVRPNNFMINPHYINRERFELGLVNLKLLDGTEVRTYNMERTICDIIRDRKKIDSQILNSALKEYMKRNDKNLNLLYEYAKKFRITKILKTYMEVLA
ncbi:MAG: type IV toxin-antitoxin system AbiEi family antitoxin domain-containing protein [Clostridia bacterium]|nr:type IV toxin-antitoxin system AbiEi family antitoxin domain-containing protein [Clostridia bacterium]